MAQHEQSLNFRLNCPSCGDHLLSTTADIELAGSMYNEGSDRARIAHGVYKMPTGALVWSQTLKDLAAQTTLPGPLERIDRVVVWFATNGMPGSPLSLTAERHRAAIGCETSLGVMWAVKQALAMRLISGNLPAAEGWIDGTLTADGWKRFAELMRDGAGSRHAFMAMKFGVAEMDVIYRDHMKIAVGHTGFELRRTDEAHKSAGLIDNRMRVEIRTSRFLICDLSHGNQGAYWEAGFAEGLGRPVIYTCSSEAFQSTDATRRPHFDTAHQSIIVWDPANPAPAMQELKDMIRATLPAEATLEDA